MNSTFQSFSSLVIALVCGLTFLISGCAENPGSVGSGLAKPGGDISTDTVNVNGFRTITANSYSGELSYFSAGEYNDPLFGDMLTTAYVRPALVGQDLSNQTSILLQLKFDKAQVYGNTGADQKYTIYEIDQIWRDRALKIHDDLQIDKNKEVASFTAAQEDSINVKLDSAWVAEYRTFVNAGASDSTYLAKFHGLAIVPENEAKIIPIDRRNSHFIIQNPAGDTLESPLGEWGYTLNRGTTSFAQGSEPIYSTYESVFNFKDLNITDIDIQASGLSRAELVLHQNESIMEQSLQSEPDSVRRPQEESVSLHFIDPEGIPENIDPGVPIDNINRIQGTYSSDTGTYRFDITTLIEQILRNGYPEGREFFVTFANNGIIKPALIYTDSNQAPEDKRPKIIITSLKNSDS